MISIALSNHSRTADDGTSSDDWWVFWKSCELFGLYLYITFALLTIGAAVEIYFSNKHTVEASIDAENQVGNLSSQVSMTETDLYPMINLAGDSDLLYLRKFKKEQIVASKQAVREKSNKRIYTIEDLLSMRPETQVGISREFPEISR